MSDWSVCRVTLAFVIVLLVGSPAAGQVGLVRPKGETEATRTLSSPSDRVMGNLSLEPESGPGWDPVGVRLLDPWDYLGAAQGNVAVPPDRHVRLNVLLALNGREEAALQRLNPRAYHLLVVDRMRNDPSDLTGLAALDPNDLYWLFVGSVTYRRAGVDPKVFEPIGRLTGLEILTLNSVGLTDAGLEYLRPLRSLKGLELSDFSLTNRGLAVLKDLPALEYLSLNTGVTDAGLQHVAQVSSLRWLNIVGGKMWGPGLAKLASLPHLERLCFWGGEGGNPITDRHLKHLEGVTQLKGLTLWGADGLTDAGLASLGRLKNLEGLYFVRSTPGFTPAGLAHLKTLKKLKTVNFAQAWSGPAGVEYGDEVVRQLTALPQLESIEGLAYLSPEGVKTLATFPNLKGLGIALRDRWQKYDGPTGLEHLARLTSLEKLSLQKDGPLSDTDLVSLESLDHLKELSIHFAGVNERGLASIGKMRQLERLHLDTLTHDGLNHLNGLSNLEYLNVSAGWDGVSRTLSPGEVTLDLSGLKKMKNLQLSQLELKEDDLTFLGELHALERLMIQQTTPLTSVLFRQLQDLPELNHLWVRGLTDCNGTDLAHLNDVPKLRSLILQGDITDTALRALEGPACLESLQIDTDHPIRKETVTNLTARHPVIEYIHVNTLTAEPVQPARVPQRRRANPPAPTNRPRARR